MNEQNQPEAAEELGYNNVLISVANPDNAKQLAQLGKFITTPQATLHIMNVTRQQPFPEREQAWRQGSDLVMDITHYTHRLGRTAKPLAATANSIPNSIVTAAGNVGADLIIMGWFGRITPIAVRRSSVVNKVLHKAPCDVSVLKSRTELGSVKKVVIPVGTNQPRPKRLAIAEKLLKQSGATGELVHVVTEDSTHQDGEEASRIFQEITDLIDVEVETNTIHANSVLEGLLIGTRGADLVLVGPGREWVFNRFLFGRTADNLTNQVDGSVIMFKGSEHKMVAWSRGLVKAIVDMCKKPFQGS